MHAHTYIHEHVTGITVAVIVPEASASHLDSGSLLLTEQNVDNELVPIVLELRASIPYHIANVFGPGCDLLHLIIAVDLELFVQDLPDHLFDFGCLESE